MDECLEESYSDTAKIIKEELPDVDTEWYANQPDKCQQMPQTAACPLLTLLSHQQVCGMLVRFYFTRGSN